MAESLITKRAIADSLKELTKEKPFDKISVKDISEKCGINRQTFYYHFEDKYLLLRWIYQTDLLDKYMEDVDFDNWTEKLELLLTAMTVVRYCSVIRMSLPLRRQSNTMIKNPIFWYTFQLRSQQTVKTGCWISSCIARNTMPTP